MFHRRSAHGHRNRVGGFPGLALLALPWGAEAVDTDRDGLDDATEATLGTDPNLPDTDGDRFSDGGEALVLATDPLLVDPYCEWPDRVVYEFGLNGDDVWPADIDHDGDLDVLELHSAAGSMVWENDGVGPFTRHDVAPNHGPWGRAFLRNIDFDLDGDEDILIGEYDAVILYENLGGWTFSVPGRILLDDHVVPKSPSIVDLDLDGDLDIVVSTNWYQYEANLFWLIRNRGDGSFSPPTLLAEYNSPNLSWVADLDLDGWPDLVVFKDGLFWYRNPGPGQPLGAPEVIGADLEVTSYQEGTLRVADLDGDGWSDFALANYDGDVSIVWNLGPLGFSEEQRVTVAEGISNSYRVWPIDMDVDGDLDIAVSRDGPARDVGWLENLGGRVFEPYEPLLDYDGDPYVLVGGDFDLDGDEDLLPVTANSEGGWRENIGVGDADRDGLDARDEVCYVGSDARDPDTDAGGVVDGVELQVGRDPLDAFDDGDADRDGIPTPLDCDDVDPDVFDGAPEVCGNGVDEDCDGLDAPCFQLSSPVPGLAGVENTLTVSLATAGSTVHLLLGLAAGTTPVPGCPGLVVDLTSPRLLGSQVVPPGGQVDFAVRVPPAGSGRTGRFQAVDLGRCEVTNLVVHAFP